MNDSIRTLPFPDNSEHLLEDRYFRRLLLHYVVWTGINPPDGDELAVFGRVEQLLGRVLGHADAEGISLADALYQLLYHGLLRVEAADPRHLYEHAEGISVEIYEPTRHVNCRFTSPDMSPFEVQAEPGRVHACRACQMLNEQLCADIEQPEPYHDDATDAVEAPKMG